VKMLPSYIISNTPSSENSFISPTHRLNCPESRKFCTIQADTDDHQAYHLRKQSIVSG
jgi:hypothetical protein